LAIGLGSPQRDINAGTSGRSHGEKPLDILYDVLVKVEAFIFHKLSTTLLN